MPKNAIPLTRAEKIRLKALGEKIRFIREKKKFTLEQVEERGFPSWKHLQAVEYGKKKHNRHQSVSFGRSSRC